MSRVTVSPRPFDQQTNSIGYRHWFNKPHDLDKSTRQIDASAILYPNNGPKRGSYGNVSLLVSWVQLIAASSPLEDVWRTLSAPPTA
jgi:hypothetical protein